MAFGPSSDEKLKFKELMDVKWLTCLFEPVKTDSGEILEFIGFDPQEKRVRIKTSSPGETEMMDDFLDEENPFSKPMTLVFDDAKTRVKLAYPSILLTGDDVSALSMINVQKVDWLTPGALLLTILVKYEKIEMLLNLVVIPGKNTEGKFPAYLSFSYFGFSIFLSAQCSDEIDDDIRPEIVKYHSELQADIADGKQD